MKYLSTVLGAIVLVYVLAPWLMADEPARLKMTGTSVPNIFDAQKPGPYNELMDQIFAAYPYKVDIDMMPMRRAQAVFKKEQVDCAFIGNDSPTFHERLGFDTKRLIFSKPFYTNKIKVYTNIDDPVISEDGALLGSVAAADLGTMQGHLVRQNAPADMEILTVETMERAFELLERGRVSSVVAFSLDAEVYFERAGTKHMFHASSEYNITTTNEAIVCWDNERSREFLSYANKILENTRIFED